MAAMTNSFENRLIDWIFRGGTTPSFAGSLYVALYTTTPTDTGGGTEVSTSGTNYARAAVPRLGDATGWAATDAAGSTAATSGGTSGTTSNNAAINFNAPGSTGWGQVNGVALLDAASGGNMLWYGGLTTPKTVNANDAAPSFAVGQLQIQIDN